MDKKSPVLNGLQLLEERERSPDFIPFQVPGIDKMLRRGLKKSGITEIYGEAGSGKTQLVLHLCQALQISHSGELAIYISTEGRVRYDRLAQISMGFAKKYPSANFAYFKGFSVFDFNDIKRLLIKTIPRILETRKVGLIVLDSVAAVFSTEDNYFLRAMHFRSLVSKLSNLSHKHGFGVVCVNQARSSFNHHRVVPALGPSWSNLIGTRVNVSRKSYETLKRKLTIVFAPNLPKISANFIITKNGIEDAE